MTNEEMMNAPYPRYIYSAIPGGGIAIVKQMDQLHTEQFVVPEDAFIDLVKQWKDLRRSEAASKIEIARTMPSRADQVTRALQLVD